MSFWLDWCWGFSLCPVLSLPSSIDLYSHLKEFLGYEVRTHLNSKGKVLSTGSSEEDRTHGAASLRTASPALHLLSCSGPKQPNYKWYLTSVKVITELSLHITWFNCFAHNLFRQVCSCCRDHLQFVFDCSFGVAITLLCIGLLQFFVSAVTVLLAGLLLCSSNDTFLCLCWTVIA